MGKESTALLQSPILDMDSYVAKDSWEPNKTQRKATRRAKKSKQRRIKRLISHLKSETLDFEEVMAALTDDNNQAHVEDALDLLTAGTVTWQQIQDARLITAGTDGFNFLVHTIFEIVDTDMDWSLSVKEVAAIDFKAISKLFIRKPVQPTTAQPPTTSSMWWQQLVAMRTLRRGGHTCPGGKKFEPNTNLSQEFDFNCYRGQQAQEHSDSMASFNAVLPLTVKYYTTSLFATDSGTSAEDTLQQMTEQECNAMMDPSVLSIGIGFAATSTTNYWTHILSKGPYGSVGDCDNERTCCDD